MGNSHGDDLNACNINKVSCTHQSIQEIQHLYHPPSLMEVDWGRNIDPNYTSTGCMLMQVVWGGKLRVNHINEYMPSEIDWGAHETHQNGHSIT